MIYHRVFLLLFLCIAASAFITQNVISPSAVSPLRMSSVSFSDKKPILVTGNNIDMTDSVKEYVEKKMEKVLLKLGADVTKVDCHLSVDQNPRISDGHIAEVTVYAKGTVIRATEKSQHMYGTIDLVSDRIARKLRKFKERKIAGKRGSKNLLARDAMQEVVIPEEVEDSDTEDDVYGEEVVDMTIVKKKAFDMPPMKVEDAVLCLDYIDHDFYVFRNEVTGEVNVVYKRNTGGVGHIEPEKK